MISIEVKNTYFLEQCLPKRGSRGCIHAINWYGPRPDAKDPAYLDTRRCWKSDSVHTLPNVGELLKIT